MLSSVDPPSPEIDMPPGGGEARIRTPGEEDPPLSFRKLHDRLPVKIVCPPAVSGWLSRLHPLVFLLCDPAGLRVISEFLHEVFHPGGWMILMIL